MIAVVAGAAAGVAGGVSLAVAAAGAVALAAAAILTPQGALRAATLVVAAALAAAADGGLARERALASPLGDWLDRHAPGARADEPVIVFGTLTDDAALVEEGARLVIDVERLGDGEVSYDVRGRIQVHVSGAMAAPAIARWVAGSRVRAPVMLRRADLLVNPGGPTESGSCFGASSTCWARSRAPRSYPCSRRCRRSIASRPASDGTSATWQRATSRPTPSNRRPSSSRS